MSELFAELNLDNPRESQEQSSSLDIAIESDTFQAVSEAEMETAASIAAIDSLMDEEQKRIREEIISKSPWDTVLALLNVEGEIGEDEIGAAAEFYAQWVNDNITPQTLNQSRFYVGGQVVQKTTEAL